MSLWVMIIPIIFIILLLMLFIFFLLISSKQDKDYKTLDKDGKVKNDAIKQTEEENKRIDNAKSGKATADKAKSTDPKDKFKKEDVFKFMEFDRVMDNMIIQNGGSRFTMAIQCKGINYDLMSELEQLSVEEGFITFLNTLKYPIQLYVQAQNIDLKGNIEKYKENIQDLTAEYNQITEEYNKLATSFDVDERKMEQVTKQRDKIANVYEYANDIIKYVEKMGTNKSLLQRRFYILLSYNTSEINAADKFNKDELIDMCATELSTRCKGVISALSSCSVSGKILNSSELADLLYSAYNRDDKSLMSVKEAVDAGMLRLYSTSYDAITKKEEKLEEYLVAQSKLRAYKAIKYAKEHGELETQAEKVIDEETEISRRATSYVKNSDFPEDEKKIATEKILADYREDKQTLVEINEQEKEDAIRDAEEKIAQIPELEKVEAPEGVKLMEKSKRIRIDPVTGEVIDDGEGNVKQPQNVEQNPATASSNTEQANVPVNENTVQNTNANEYVEQSQQNGEYNEENNSTLNVYGNNGDDEEDDSIV